MDILQIRKKRMMDLVHEGSEAPRTPSGNAERALPPTTGAHFGETGAPLPPIALDTPAVMHATSESATEILNATPSHRIGPDSSRVEPAPESREPLSSDPLVGFLARHDVVDADEDPFSAAGASPVDVPRFLTFDLGPESYAANIVDIREIIKMIQVTPVPRAPPGVLGVISKRGVVMPVVDLAAALRLRPARRDLLPDQRVLVTGDGDAVVGLRVDRVHGVVSLPHDELGPLPSGLSTNSVAFFRGLARRPDGMFLVIDLAVFREHLTIAAREGTLV